MIGSRQEFYHSKEWERLVKQLKIERTNNDGLLMCEHCGKPIIKSYDCIGHHKIELNDDNYKDVMIALNPDNIQLIHFRCHNEIHKRFGFSGVRKPQEVYIVWGFSLLGENNVG